MNPTQMKKLTDALTEAVSHHCFEQAKSLVILAELMVKAEGDAERANIWARIADCGHFAA